MREMTAFDRAFPVALSLVLLGTAAGGAEPPDGTVSWTSTFAFGTPEAQRSGGAQALAVQPDGRIVIAGWVSDPPGERTFAVVRLREDGVPDPEFGVGGVVLDPIPALGEFRPWALAVEQGTGRIVVAGWEVLGVNETAGGVVRLTSEGDPDPTFDGDGYRQVVYDASPVGESTTFHGVVVDPIGRILLAGETYSSTLGNVMALARLSPTGDLDPTFAVGGLKMIDLPGGTNGAESIVLLPDTRIVLGGTVGNDLAVVRLLPNGPLDTTFSEDGLALADFGGQIEGANGALIDAAGRAVVFGFTCSHYEPQFCDSTTWAVARFTANGDPDTTFDGDGRTRGPDCPIPRCGPLEAADAGVYQGDGRLLLAGNFFQPSAPLEGDFVLHRLTADGQSDPTFGDAGWARADFGEPGTPRSDTLYALALAPDGRPVAAGDSRVATPDIVFAAARWSNSYIFADGFDTGFSNRWTPGAPIP